MMTDFSVTPGSTRGPASSSCSQSEGSGTPDQVRGDGGKKHDPGFTPARRSAEHGFTLVELMVVIVIIGLLATIVALNVLPSGDKARVEKAKADISQIEGGLELYKLQNLNYPTTGQGLQALVTMPAGLADPSRYQRGGYLKKLPEDPWGHPYLYAAPGKHGEADVWTYGADGKEGGEGIDADIGSWQ